MSFLNRFTLILTLSFLFQSGFAQNAIELPEEQLQKSEVEAHLRFIASEELKGRRTSDMGSEIAARYISEQFRSFGVKTIEGADEYFQHECNSFIE